jgi:hypothetical protein
MSNPNDSRELLRQKLHTKLRNHKIARGSIALQENLLDKRNIPEKLKEPLLQWLKFNKTLPFPEEILKDLCKQPPELIDQLIEQLKNRPKVVVKV